MNIPKEKMKKVDEIKKLIQENKYKTLNIEELIDYIFNNCSTVEKQNSFISGITLGLYAKEYETKNIITKIIKG